MRPKAQDEPGGLSVNTAAARLGLHPGTVRKLAQAGELPARRRGARDWVLDRDAVEDLAVRLAAKRAQSRKHPPRPKGRPPRQQIALALAPDPRTRGKRKRRD